MNRDQFEELLLLHGADLRRWPTGLGEAAQARIASDEEARRLLDAARAADAAVLAASHVAPSGDLAARIVAAATGDEEAIFNVTPAGVAGALAGSLGLAGIGYAATAAIAGLVVPAALLDIVSAVVASGMPGAF